jgi:uroporphyrinogen III methyltransferase/synthase
MLTGKTILVTRSKNASAEIRGLLESHGAAVICLPTIEIGEPESWKECDASIWKLAEYDSVCFTSKNAVDKFIQRVRLIRPQALNTLATRNLYAVGEKTKSIVEANGYSVQPVPQQHSAEHLAHSFYGQNLSGRHFLFPKSNIAHDGLPKELRSLGASVDEIVTYSTRIPEPDNLEQVRVLLKNGTIDIITFFSPSSICNFVEMFDVEILTGTFIAVIGPTTAAAVNDVGLSVGIIAQQQTAESLVEGIVARFDTA